VRLTQDTDAMTSAVPAPASSARNQLASITWLLRPATTSSPDDPLPDDLRYALCKIGSTKRGTH
jgi:hypothetical protein